MAGLQALIVYIRVPMYTASSVILVYDNKHRYVLKVMILLLSIVHVYDTHE